MRILWKTIVNLAIMFRYENMNNIYKKFQDTHSTFVLLNLYIFWRELSGDFGI